MLKLDAQLYGTAAEQVEEAGTAPRAEAVDLGILRDYFGQSANRAATGTAGGGFR